MTNNAWISLGSECATNMINVATRETMYSDKLLWEFVTEHFDVGWCCPLDSIQYVDVDKEMTVTYFVCESESHALMLALKYGQIS